MDSSISQNLLDQLEKRFDENPGNRMAMNAAVSCGICASSRNYETEREVPHEFSISLEQGAVTNQKRSGRCWMFAALNCMRFQVIKKQNLEDFELSQSYPLFYDKLEKANYFLESILDTLDEPTDGRLIAHLLAAPLNDGGQWDMLCSIVEKYGLVPKTAMPESVSSSATQEMVSYMTEKLREYACVLRKGYKAGKSMEQLKKEKEAMMETVYRMLCISLGKPPKTFTFEYRDKDGNFHREENLTPKAFYEKYVGLRLDDYVSVINAPTEDKPFYRSYTVQYLGNVKEGRPVKYVNLPIEEMKQAAIAQLKDGEPVWFGCDVGKRSFRDGGLMDTGIYDVETLFDTDFPMTKAERLEYGQSLMTHAMVFQGVNLDENGRPDRWRVENSWGEEAGKKGYFVMSDRWFDEYNYQVVVNKKYLSSKALEAYEMEPVRLNPWDPMGSLA
ncbi:MAG TPA: C1 family peptidase [Candidatus Pullilachnospira stercoravium]|uniref:Aminopeptidase n=1 Tax=Candidatus Pullilachnospira stercoravium TaxID=2840913 RepID=A0A9D1T7A2_9FIRM|nr:C1 family peptidase [Candidatus Pullilachnospira stercoravium]